MAVGALPVQSDPTLLADIRRYGTFDSAACYQCGSCTLSCDLVNGSVSFPRRSIRYALLGLRAPLLGSLEPWICHDCGECSTACPRQAEPRISMVTLRRFLSAQYDWTGITSRLLQSKAWYLGSLVFVAVFTFLLIHRLSPLVRRAAGRDLGHNAAWARPHVPDDYLLHACGDPASVGCSCFRGSSASGGSRWLGRPSRKSRLSLCRRGLDYVYESVTHR